MWTYSIYVHSEALWTTFTCGSFSFSSCDLIFLWKSFLSLSGTGGMRTVLGRKNNSSAVKFLSCSCAVFLSFDNCISIACPEHFFDDLACFCMAIDPDLFWKQNTFSECDGTLYCTSACSYYLLMLFHKSVSSHLQSHTDFITTVFSLEGTNWVYMFQAGQFIGSILEKQNSQYHQGNICEIQPQHEYVNSN